MNGSNRNAQLKRKNSFSEIKNEKKHTERRKLLEDEEWRGVKRRWIGNVAINYYMASVVQHYGKVELRV